MSHAFGAGPFAPLEDQVRRNMEMFERAFAMFMPFARREAQNAEAEKTPAAPPAARSTISSASSTRCRSGSRS